MSDRERWIVYPLLFLAIGMSWHDKIAPTHRVMTHDLIVVNDDERPAFRVKATPKGDAAVYVYRGWFLDSGGTKPRHEDLGQRKN